MAEEGGKKTGGFWAYGRDRLDEVSEAKPVTVKDLESEYAATQDPERRSKLRDLIDSLKDELIGVPSAVDKRLF